MSGQPEGLFRSGQEAHEPVAGTEPDRQHRLIGVGVVECLHGLGAVELDDNPAALRYGAIQRLRIFAAHENSAAVSRDDVRNAGTVSLIGRRISDLEFNKEIPFGHRRISLGLAINHFEDEALNRFQLRGIDRKLPQALAGECKNRVNYGWGDRRGARFTDAAWLLVRIDHVHFDRWSLIDAQDFIVVEIALLDAAILEGDLAVQGRGQPKDNTPFHLRLDGVGIDHLPAIQRADDAFDADPAILADRDLGYLRDVTAEAEHDGHPAADSCRQRFVPAGFVRDEIEYCFCARGIA